MMKQSEDKKIEKLQTMIFTGILVAVFVLLICLVWPDGQRQFETCACRSGHWRRPGFPSEAEAMDFSLPIMAITARILS